jgi:hypothetical protein
MTGNNQGSTGGNFGTSEPIQEKNRQRMDKDDENA